MTQGAISPVPAAEGGAAGQAFAPRRAAAQAVQAGAHGGLVDEDQPMRHLANDALTARPVGPRAPERGPLTLGRDQAFFYIRSRRP